MWPPPLLLLLLLLAPTPRAARPPRPHSHPATPFAQSSVTCHKCSARSTMYEPFLNLRCMHLPCLPACCVCATQVLPPARPPTRPSTHNRPPARPPTLARSLPLVREGKGSSFAWLGIKGAPTTLADCLTAFTADEKLEVRGVCACGWGGALWGGLPPTADDKLKVRRVCGVCVVAGVKGWEGVLHRGPCQLTLSSPSPPPHTRVHPGRRGLLLRGVLRPHAGHQAHPPAPPAARAVPAHQALQVQGGWGWGGLVCVCMCCGGEEGRVCVCACTSSASTR